MKFKKHDIIGIRSDNGVKLQLEIFDIDFVENCYEIFQIRNTTTPEKQGKYSWWDCGITDSLYVKIGESKVINYNDYWAKLNEI